MRPTRFGKSAAMSLPSKEECRPARLAGIPKKTSGGEAVKLRDNHLLCAVAVAAVMAFAPAPVLAQDITIAVAEQPDALDSTHAYQASHSTILRNIYETLTARAPVTGELVPSLATAWEQIDETTWHFTIREGVKFHDGSDLNAEVVAFGLDWTWNADRSGSISIRGFMGPTMEFEAIDDYLLEIRLSDPDPLLPTRLYASTIPSMQQVRNDPEGWLISPIGTGPYQFVEWVRGSHVDVERFDGWWGLTADDAQGDSAFESARFLIRTENAARIAALRAGEVLMAERLAPDVCLIELGDDCINAPASSHVFIKMDNNHPVLGDARIRMAISHAIDREGIGEAIMGGASPVSQLVAASVLGHDPELPPHEFDPERARELIAEAAADGVPVNEMPLRLIARQDSFPGNDQVLEAILEMMSQVGLTNVGASILEPSSFNPIWLTNYAEIEEDRGVMALHRQPNEWFDLAPVASIYYVCWGQGASYCSEEATETFALGSAASGSEREAYLKELSRIVYEDNPYTMIVDQPLFHGVDTGQLSWTPRIDMSILLKDMAPVN